MIRSYLAAVLVRDLSGLKRELLAYAAEDQMWQTAGRVNNSAGSLAVHVVGNLRHFVGSMLGSNGYQRDREKEFADRPSRQQLLAMLDTTIDDVRTTLTGITDERLAQPLGMRNLNALDFLVHLATHLSYHLGQVDYHRRMVGNNGDDLKILSTAELTTAG